ncbi:uncharacterized protein PAC_12504 [Phialocephala subalpina]|uniref:Uncharacterized protein n=1 Tax=Phialocephala subalpina TaxID=576137 RepID=A0A1L7XCA7_9HELO|nr:uncharacterized protein PAC_12504 [Phialocephala subalpina]
MSDTESTASFASAASSVPNADEPRSTRSWTSNIISALTNAGIPDEIPDSLIVGPLLPPTRRRTNRHRPATTPQVLRRRIHEHRSTQVVIGQLPSGEEIETTEEQWEELLAQLAGEKERKRKENRAARLRAERRRGLPGAEKRRCKYRALEESKLADRNGKGPEDEPAIHRSGGRFCSKDQWMAERRL